MNTDFARALRADTLMDSKVTEDVDFLPALQLDSEALDPTCPKESVLRDLWNRAFQELRWTRVVPRPTLTVRHHTGCEAIKVAGVDPYLRVVHHIYLTESNVLFEVKGEVFRQNVSIDFDMHLDATDRSDDESANRTWAQKGAYDAIQDMTAGYSIPDISLKPRPDLPGADPPGAELAAFAGDSPGMALAGRLILGGDVRSDRGRWRYANGTEVPDTLLDKSSGKPPLRPKTQRPVTQPPVSSAIASIKSTLGAIKSCQLYTSATKENLLWSVLSPAFEMDDADVVVSRYVLSTRPSEGYAQGASIANLALPSAQVQDRGGCRVLSIPCKNGQCVRFEDNANPSLTFFVETAEQANRILSELKVLAPLYPDGAGEVRK